MLALVLVLLLAAVARVPAQKNELCDIIEVTLLDEWKECVTSFLRPVPDPIADLNERYPVPPERGNLTETDVYCTFCRFAWTTAEAAYEKKNACHRSNLDFFDNLDDWVGVYEASRETVYSKCDLSTTSASKWLDLIIGAAVTVLCLVCAVYSNVKFNKHYKTSGLDYH